MKRFLIVFLGLISILTINVASATDIIHIDSFEVTDQAHWDNTICTGPFPGWAYYVSRAEASTGAEGLGQITQCMKTLDAAVILFDLGYIWLEDTSRLQTGGTWIKK